MVELMTLLDENGQGFTEGKYSGLWQDNQEG